MFYVFFYSIYLLFSNNRVLCQNLDFNIDIITVKEDCTACPMVLSLYANLELALHY